MIYIAPRKKGNNYIIDEENGIAKIELRRKMEENLWATISLKDLERVLNFPYTWSPSWNDRTKTYYCHTIDYSCHPYKKIALQVFIANPKDNTAKVDHINHDTLDNRRENLRVIEQNQNLKNRNGKNSNNKSGYRNVAYIKADKKTPYHVQLMVNGKNTLLEKFSDVNEAGAYAEKMREKYYGEFAGVS
jgi:hypothetical protein